MKEHRTEDQSIWVLVPALAYTCPGTQGKPLSLSGKVSLSVRWEISACAVFAVKNK